MQDLTSYSHCTCSNQGRFMTIKGARSISYFHKPRFIDLCAICQHCIDCHSSDHKFKRQQAIKGLCTRGQKGMECGKPIIREGMCRKHFHQKYGGQRAWVLKKPSFSAEERAFRAKLSYEWTRKAPSVEEWVVLGDLQEKEPCIREKVESEEQEIETPGDEEIQKELDGWFEIVKTGLIEEELDYIV